MGTKLGRSASLVGFGLLFLLGGWQTRATAPTAGSPHHWRAGHEANDQSDRGRAHPDSDRLLARGRSSFMIDGRVPVPGSKPSVNDPRPTDSEGATLSLQGRGPPDSTIPGKKFKASSPTN